MSLTKVTLLCLLLSFAISLLISSISLLFQASETQPVSATEPFECGFDPLSPYRSSFFVQFFMIGVVFVMFDIETMLMIPLFRSLLSIYEWCALWIFLWLILLLGLLMEIHFGSTDWKEFS
nr:NADH dehydrogenase subunit 3 [Hoplopleura pacifica]